MTTPTATGTVVLISEDSTEAQPYVYNGTDNGVVILRNPGTNPLNLFLDLVASKDNIVYVIDANFNLRFVRKLGADVPAPDVFDLGNRRFIIDSFTITSNVFALFVWDNGQPPSSTGKFASNPLGDLAFDSITDGLEGGKTWNVLGEDDEDAFKKFHICLINSNIRTVDDAFEEGLKVLLVDCTIQSTALQHIHMLSHSHPCTCKYQTATESGQTNWSIEADQVRIVIKIIHRRGKTISFTTPTDKSYTLEIKSFDLEAQEGDENEVAPLLEFDAIHGFTIKPHDGANLVFDCDIRITQSERKLEIEVPPHLFESCTIVGRVEDDSVALQSSEEEEDAAAETVDGDDAMGGEEVGDDGVRGKKRSSGAAGYTGRFLNVHVPKGAGVWKPGHGNLCFEGTSSDIVQGWDQAVNTSVLTNFRVELEQPHGGVTFKNVIFTTEPPPEDPSGASPLPLDEAEYALRVDSRVSKTASQKSVPVKFEGASVVVVRHGDANGILLDSTGESDSNRMRPRLAFAFGASLKSYREFTLDAGANLRNVGVVFMGDALPLDERLSIGEFDMSHMGFSPPADDGPTYSDSLVFGTPAMVVDHEGKSVLEELLRVTNPGVEIWNSRKGHHLTSWKFDEAPVFYRKIDGVSGRKICFLDEDCTQAAKIRKILVFVLGTPSGFTGPADSFTGADGDLDVRLVLRSHAHIEDEGELGALNRELFGSPGLSPGDPGEAPHVGIAGFLNSETGGADVIKVFDLRKGEVMIRFETDEGFVQPDPAGQDLRRFYYLGDSVVQARFTDRSDTVKFVRSNYPSAWGLPPFTYAFVEKDVPELKIYVTVNGTTSLHEPQDEVDLSETGLTVRLDSDHAFLTAGTEIRFEAEENSGQQLSGALVVDSTTSFDDLQPRSLIQNLGLYDFTYSSSPSIPLKHSTNMSSWNEGTTATVIFGLFPYSEESDPVQTAPLKMKATVGIIKTAPNVFLWKRQDSDNPVPDVGFQQDILGSKNAFAENLFLPEEAADAVYKFDSTNMENSVVESETFELGMTMFSKASELYNSFVTINGDIGLHTGYQLFALVPLETEDRLYVGEPVNTFRQTTTAKWTFDTPVNASFLDPDAQITFSDGLGLPSSGTYKILKVNNTVLGSPSQTIWFKVRARSTDAETDMENQFMKQIMCARFAVVPLKRSATSETTPKIFNLFSRVPIAYRILQKGGQLLTSITDRRVFRYKATSTLGTTRIQFVAKPATFNPSALGEGYSLRFQIRTMSSGWTTHSTNQFRTYTSFSATPPYTIRLGTETGDTIHDRIFNSTTSSNNSIQLFAVFHSDSNSRRIEFQTAWHTFESQGDDVILNSREFEVDILGIAAFNNSNTETDLITALGNSVLASTGVPTPADNLFKTLRLNWVQSDVAITEDTTGAFRSATAGVDPSLGNWSLAGYGMQRNESTVTETLTVRAQIRSSSRAGFDFPTTEQLDWTRTFRFQEEITVQPGQAAVFDSSLQPTLVGNPLVRGLASKSERVWVGMLFSTHEYLSGTQDEANLRVHFIGTFEVGVMGDLETGSVPTFHTSYLGGAVVDADSPAVYMYSSGHPNPAWTGAWLDCSGLEVTGTPETIRCKIEAVVRSGDGQITRIPEAGLKLTVGYVDLTDAGRVELFELGQREYISKIRIGNWALYSDSAGHLRFDHRPFLTGEGSSGNATLDFTMPGTEVKKLADADGEVQISGENFKFTGNPNSK